MDRAVEARKRGLPRFHLSGVSRVWFLNAILTALALYVFFGSTIHLEPIHAPLRIHWFTFAAMFAIAEIGVVHFQLRRDAHSFSLSEVALVLGLFFGSPKGLMLGQLLGSFAALAIHRRQSALKLVFNLSNFCLQAGLTIALFHRMLPGHSPTGAGGWASAFMATGISSIASILAIFVAISLSQGSPQVGHLPQALGFGLVVTITNVSLGLIGVTVMWTNSAAAALLLIPAGTLFLAYRAYLQEREKGESLEFLHESTQIIHRSTETEAAMTAMLEQARKMFRADYAEIRLYPDEAGAGKLVLSVGPDDRRDGMRPLLIPFDSDGPVAPALRGERAMLFPRPVLDDGLRSRFPHLHVKDAMVTPLRGETRVIGVLVVLNRLGDVSTFDAEDLRLFETFANHASVALENGRLEKSLAALTELKEQLRHQAFHDSVTGLANRVLFSDRVEHALARKGGVPERISIMFVDLDDFKMVNDSLGHAAGDELLRAVAGRIEAALRPGDTAARLGGDEFAVLLENTGEIEAELVAARILEALGAPFRVAGSSVNVRASVGIATGLPQENTAEEVLRNADVAMYAAKEAGKGRAARFEPAMHASVVGRIKLEADLRDALERDGLTVEYQPIVDLHRSDRPIGAEALIRWRDGDGSVTPTDLIALAERTGQILPLGRWVLEQACHQARAWRRELPDLDDLNISVNMSVLQLRDPNLAKMVDSVLRTSGLPSDALTIEVTESAMMVDVESSVAALTQLRELGVKIAVDDFGTGYSSLSYLRRFPLDKLKIDKTFVDGVALGPDDSALSKAIIRIGRTLNLVTVAEGIENGAQLEALRALGCDYGQGFHVGRPMQSHEMTMYLRSFAAAPPDVGDLPAPTAVA